MISLPSVLQNDLNSIAHLVEEWSDLYAWFIGVFDAKDLQEAKALLDVLI